MTNIFDEKFQRVLEIYEKWIKRSLSDSEKEVANHFFLQGIAASQLYPELNQLSDNECALAAEPSLEKDWLTPEEDKAWEGL